MSIADSNFSPEISACAEKCPPSRRGTRLHDRKLRENRKPYPMTFAKYFEIEPWVSESNVVNLLFVS